MITPPTPRELALDAVKQALNAGRYWLPPGGQEVAVDAVLALVGPEACCVCGGGPVTYRNYREQDFCQPCADPAATTESELDIARRRAVTFQARLDDARDWARRNLTAEQQTGLLKVLRGDLPKEPRP